MSNTAARAEWREKRTKVIRNFCKEYDLGLIELNDGYQLRIENVIDIYPTNGRYHILKSGKRGDWHLSKPSLVSLIREAKEATVDVVPDVAYSGKVSIVDEHGRTYTLDEFNKSKDALDGIEVTGADKITVHDVDTLSKINEIEQNDQMLRKKRGWFKRLLARITSREPGTRSKWDY